MTDRVACTECGTLVLPETAAANGGLCVPCKRGFRKKLEESKRWYQQRKEVLANPDPTARHWRWLVDQVHRTPAGFGGLSEPNKLYFAAVLLEGEIYNGGFDQYFHNSSADHFAYAVRALEEMEAGACLEALNAAKELYFGAGDVPASQAERFQHARRMTPARERKLSELDRRFSAASAGLRDGAAAFARRHALFEAP
jgi:hypothetical protein